MIARSGGRVMPFISCGRIEIKDAITILIALGAVIAGLVQYRSTARGEFLKPIRENQLKLYVDASSAAASIATLSTDSPEWMKAKMDFLRLYWGPLAMVEDYQHDLKPGVERTITVELAMMAFKKCLDDKECVGSSQMKNLSLALADTCRISLGSSWGFKAKQLEGDYSKLIREYLNI
jgi:hypothetical protein